MKNVKLLFGMICLLSFSLQSCLKDKCSREVTYTKATPIYITLEEMKADIASESPRELKQPGKIYFYNKYIFINERNEGIHIIDNTNPENPQNVSFLKIPGNVDIAIKDNVLIADSYLFLTTIDISNPLHAQLIGREEHWNNYFPQGANDNYIIGYEYEEVTEVVDCSDYGTYHEDIANSQGTFQFNNAPMLTSTGQSFGQAGGVGVAGSMARFSIYGDYLYTVDDHNMHVIDIADPTNPNKLNTIWIGSDIETIFPYGDKLFIGSRNGMFIYDNSNPTEPIALGSFEHARACDPVFVKDNYAYVTLHSGNIMCDGFTNQLDLIDISDLMNPQLIKTFPMDNPHGLSIKGNNLFLCEGDFGLKTFDIETPETLDERLMSHLEGFSTYDVIAVPGNENILLIIGEDGFFQYNFDNPENLVLLSKIPVN